MTLRGRLLQKGPDGAYPAARVGVLLKPIMRDAVTGQDGIFYLYKIPPGNYTLEVSTRAIRVSYPIEVPKGTSSAYQDIPSITLPAK